jgi:hypothetical protein
MPETKRIANDQLAHYFDAFSKRFLMDDSPESANIEILSPTLGDQHRASGVRLLGITYDKHTNALEVELDSGDHRTYKPREVWAVEEPDGFVSALDIVRSDGAREVVTIKRG